MWIKYDYKANWISKGNSWWSSYSSEGPIKIDFENEHYAEDEFRKALVLLPRIASLSYYVTFFFRTLSNRIFNY